MKVLHVQRVKGIGGSERHLLSLLPRLKEKGLDVTLVALIVEGGDRFADEATSCGIKTHAIQERGMVSPGALRTLRQIALDLRPHLVHTHLIHADLYGFLLASRLGAPVLSTVHGPHILRRWLARHMRRLIDRRIIHTVSISPSIRDALLKNRITSPQKTTVIPYGVDIAKWRVERELRLAGRKMFNLSEEDVAVIITSRLIPGKGHSVLVDAFEDAVQRVPQLKLLIAGEGESRQALEAKVRQLSSSRSIRFLGFVDDIRLVLAAGDIFTLPTEPQLGEGFGLSLLEAMAAGLPSIASRISSIPYIIEDGRSGIIANPIDLDEWSGALEELGKSRQGRMNLGAAAQLRAEEEFSLERMVDRTVKLYETVALPPQNGT